MQSVRVTICGPLDCLAGERRQAETSDMHACLSIPRIIWIFRTVVNGFSFSTQFMWPYPFNSHLNYGGWHSVGHCCMFITFVKFFLFIDRHLSYFVARPQAVKHRGTSQYMAIIFYAIVHQSRAQRCLFVFCVCVLVFVHVCSSSPLCVMLRVKTASGRKPIRIPSRKFHIWWIYIRTGYGVARNMWLCANMVNWRCEWAAPSASRYIIQNKFFNTLRNAIGRKLSLAVPFHISLFASLFPFFHFRSSVGWFLLNFFGDLNVSIFVVDRWSKNIC